MSPRARTIGLWTLTVLLSLTFFSAGIGKVADVDPSPANFTRWGLSMTFMHFIGAAELLGAIGLLIPRLSPLAAIGLILTMLGAIRTGVVFGEAMHIALPAVLVVLLAVLIYARRDMFRLRARSAPTE